jgi:hypothetical protein
MSGKGWGLVWLTLSLATSAATAVAGPWDLLTRTSVEASSAKSYALTAEHGPWMILACTFSGDTAEEEARELVLELRTKYKLRAYSYNKRFELEEKVGGLGVDKFGEPLKMRYQRGDEITEHAVMVGDFASIDDYDAQHALRTIKHCQPECLKASKDDPSSRTLGAWRALLLVGKEENRKKGPMYHAFMTTNPMIPKEQFLTHGLDDFVVKLNSDSPYSLLNCPGKYTVQVAHFTGRVVTDQSEIDKAAKSDDWDSRLAEAGVKAEKLTEALRMKGYEAYSFHDRSASLVTVGSFDSVGSPRSDGRIEINRQVLQIMETFKGQEAADQPGQIGAQIIAEIPLDIQPIPVLVPKRSISAAYQRRTLGMR